MNPKYANLFKQLEATFDSPRKINPLNDAYFKFLFGSQQNKKLTLELINSTFELAIDKHRKSAFDIEPREMKFDGIEFVNTELNRINEDQRGAIVDVLVRANDESIVHIEAQADKINIDSRLSYYQACLLISQLDRGASWDDIKPIFSIAIMDFNVIHNKNNEFYIHPIGNIAYTRLEPIDSKIMRYYVELPKFKLRGHGDLKPSEYLIAYLCKNRYAKEAPHFLKELQTMNQTFQKMESLENAFYADRDSRHAYLTSEITSIDIRSQIKAGMDAGEARGIEIGMARGIEIGAERGKIEGFMDGRAKGRIEGVKKTIKNMLEAEFPITSIAKATKYSIDQIKAIQQELIKSGELKPQNQQKKNEYGMGR